MKKNIKNIIVIVLCLILVVAASVVFVCCNKPDDGNGSVQTIDPPSDGIEKTKYAITVLLPDGKPVVGIEVKLLLADDDEVYAAATTGNDGVAYINTGIGLDYVIFIENLPEGYIYEDDVIIYSDEKAKSVYLSSANATDRYDLTVITEGGMPMENVTVTLKDGEITIGTKKTNENGVASIRVAETKVYSVELSDLPLGYKAVESSISTTEKGGAQEIKVVSSVIKEDRPKNTRYTMDDIIHDFSVITSDGKTFTLSEALEEYDFVMINFWATWCSPCRAEFDDIQLAYERYQDKMCVIALSTEDTDSLSVIADFKSNYSPVLTFDMAQDTANLYSCFSAYSGGAIPTTIFVDRYGKICNFIKGGGTEALFRQEFERYTASDYVQSKYNPNAVEIPVDKPDQPNVEMPESSEIVDAINKGGFTGEYGGSDDEMVWPWVIKDDTFVAGNIRHRNTTSMFTYKFKLNDGEFITFDYMTNTEDIDGADALSVYIDGSWVCDLDRVTNNEWKTCHLYTPISASIDPEDSEREHMLLVTYTKDTSDSWLEGTEVVAIKNMRAAATSEISGNVNVLRDASWNFDSDKGQWTNYITPVFNEDDGYYHVDTKDGPYLLANLNSGTHYSNASVSEYSNNGILGSVAGLNGLVSFISSGIENAPADSYVESYKGYAWFSGNSDLPGYTLVDERLRVVLDTMCNRFSTTEYQGNKLGSYYTPNSWLEFCSYYDNYSGEAFANPLKGLGQKEAIVALGNDQANHVVVDKVLVPRGVIYKYIPEVTGAYRIYSKRPNGSQQGCYIDIQGKGAHKGEDALGDFSIYVTMYAGETYYISVALDLPSTLGELDFYIKHLGESMDVMTDCTDGTYTWLEDEKGNPVLDEDGETIYVINRVNGFKFGLGEDKIYYQMIDGKLDSGDKGKVYINLSTPTMIFNATLKDLASGKSAIEGLSGKFFDLTSVGGRDYSDYILELAEEAEKNEGDLHGMVVATEELVDILSKALARIGHNSEDSWLGCARYYEHVGNYLDE